VWSPARRRRDTEAALTAPDPSAPVTLAVLTVFAVVGAGVLLRRADWLTEEADRSLMNLTVRLLLPCLILDTTLGNAALRETRNVLWPPLVGIAGVLVGIGTAWLVARLAGRRLGLDDAGRRRTWTLAVGIQNWGYIPIPMVKLLFDQGTLGVLLVHNVGVELAFWTVGVLALTGRGAGPGWRGALNPPSLAVVAGVALNRLGAAPVLPGFGLSAIGMLGEACIPVALLLVGATAADHLREARGRRDAASLVTASVLRLALVPLVLVAAALLLPLSLELRRVLLVQAAMPSAMFPVVLSRYHDGDPPTALRVMLATSLVALVTTPLWLSATLPLLPR
jgi:hypothetical protein